MDVSEKTSNEKRLIDANALRAKCDAPHWCVWMSDIDDAPTVDAVELVRCRDCKHWHKETLFCDYMPYVEAQDRVNWYADDFCSYGEQMEDRNEAD